MTGVQTLVPIMLDHVNAGRLSLARFPSLFLLFFLSCKPCRLSLARVPSLFFSFFLAFFHCYYITSKVNTAADFAQRNQVRDFIKIQDRLFAASTAFLPRCY